MELDFILSQEEKGPSGRTEFDYDLAVIGGGPAEFPHLINKYQVMGVPKIVINEKFGFEGTLSESAFLDAVIEADK